MPNKKPQFTLDNLFKQAVSEQMTTALKDSMFSCEKGLAQTHIIIEHLNVHDFIEDHEDLSFNSAQVKIKGLNQFVAQVEIGFNQQQSIDSNNQFITAKFDADFKVIECEDGVSIEIGEAHATDLKCICPYMLDDCEFDLFEVIKGDIATIADENPYSNERRKVGEATTIPRNNYHERMKLVKGLNESSVDKAKYFDYINAVINGNLVRPHLEKFLNESFF